MSVVVETSRPTVDQVLDWTPDELVRIRTLIGLRRHWMRTLFPQLAEEYEDAVAGEEPATMEAARDIVDRLPGRNRFLALDRYIQLRLWNEVGRVADDRLARYPDLLEPDDADLGILEVHPRFEQPDYYRSYDFHRQEGGIWRGDRGALVYALGARVIHVDSKQPHALHDELAARVPDDLTVERVVDLACGFGKTTFSIARRFNGAEVIASDLSAPVLRLGRKLASEQGLAIHWQQADAEDTSLPDDSVDLVTVSMALHELPLESITSVCREAHRILRPGGVFLALETRLIGDPFRDLLGAYHSEITGEPYINAFRASAFDDFARGGGFEDIEVLDFRPPGAPPSVDRKVWSTPWSLLQARKA